MYIKEDYNFEDLQKNCWSGAEETLKIIEEKGKEESLMDFLEVYYNVGIEKTPTLTEVNDLLWFDDDMIFLMLDIEVDE